MKIRKGILAAATAATVSLTGVVAAPAYAQDDVANATIKTDSKGNPLPEGSSGKQVSQTTTDLFYKWDNDAGRYKINPTQIVSWIGVFTTALAAIGTVISFVQKNFNIKF